MVAFFVLFSVLAFAKPAENLHLSQDTSRLLQEVEISAFAHRKPLAVVPASVGVITAVDLQRFNNSNLLPVFNTIPGVRMEERSPGSYRLSIRGSSIRSPFGVRNVKLYWNGIPLTDASGNTYLNLLDFAQVDRVEVIRGPGSSLYGAGTGGVVLLDSKLRANSLTADAVAGGYGLRRLSAGFSTGDSKKNLSLSVARQFSDGYREQSAMERTAFMLHSSLAAGSRTTFSFSGLYSDLFYQTPGALTLAQYQADPAQARPAGGPNAGAVEQKATVYNQTWLGGVTMDHDWNHAWQTRLSVFANSTRFRNPAIRNYEERAEGGFGFRMVTEHPFASGRLLFGAEAQTGNSHIEVYRNNSGVRGDLTSDSKAPVSTGSIFTQADFNLPHQFFLTAGFSLNKYTTSFIQQVPDAFDDKQQSDLIPVPRIGVSKKIGTAFTFFGNAGQGFSPPTTAEVFPSTASYNKDLKAEIGTSSEAGVRYNGQSLSASLVTYHLSLRRTIVVTRDESGADYFFNSGRTRQRGIEASASWKPEPGTAWWRAFRGWTNITRSNFQFVDYVRNDVDYSGNQLTGTPEYVAVAGIDFAPQKGWYLNATATYNDRTPLDDANTAWASEYYVFSFRTGYAFEFRNNSMQVFGGVDNLTDRLYSLGNDLNAVAGRYYNAAPGRSFYAGLRVALTRR